MEDTHFSTCLVYISISHLLDAILGSGNEMWKKNGSALMRLTLWWEETGSNSVSKINDVLASVMIQGW